MTFSVEKKLLSARKSYYKSAPTYRLAISTSKNSRDQVVLVVGFPIWPVFTLELQVGEEGEERRIEECRPLTDGIRSKPTRS